MSAAAAAILKSSPTPKVFAIPTGPFLVINLAVLRICRDDHGCASVLDALMFRAEKFGCCLQLSLAYLRTLSMNVAGERTIRKILTELQGWGYLTVNCDTGNPLGLWITLNRDAIQAALDRTAVKPPGFATAATPAKTPATPAKMPTPTPENLRGYKQAENAEKKNKKEGRTTTAQPPAIVEVPPPKFVPSKKAPISANAPIPAGDSPIIDLITQEAGPQIANDAKALSPEDAMQAVAAFHEYAQHNEIENKRGLYRTLLRKSAKPNNPLHYNKIRKLCALGTSPTAPSSTVDPPPAATVPDAVAYPRCRLCGEETTPYECLVHDGSNGMIHGRCQRNLTKQNFGLPTGGD